MNSMAKNTRTISAKVDWQFPRRSFDVSVSTRASVLLDDQRPAARWSRFTAGSSGSFLPGGPRLEEEEEEFEEELDDDEDDDEDEDWDDDDEEDEDDLEDDEELDDDEEDEADDEDLDDEWEEVGDD